ncbi:MAG: response regulator, partial [Phycisphaerales bacterium]|nr:response regulator [Phycisphaerales bacterium]
EVAEICNISQQTVIRCFDKGALRGYRVPGSRFRRIPRDSLIQFMKDNGIPLTQIEMGKRRVLVVDDDPAILEMLVELLERTGDFEVQTAATGFDAGKEASRFRPDVIVLDFMLPDINGNAVIKSIRGDEALRETRIIIVSGVVNRDDVKSLLETGADDFLQKPFSVDELVAKINDLVNQTAG